MKRIGTKGKMVAVGRKGVWHVRQPPTPTTLKPNEGFMCHMSDGSVYHSHVHIVMSAAPAAPAPTTPCASPVTYHTNAHSSLLNGYCPLSPFSNLLCS